MGNVLTEILESVSATDELVSAKIRLRCPITSEQMEELSRRYRDLRFERTSKGELITMSPTGGESGERNFNIITQLGNWTREDRNGRGFDSSTGFALPNQSDRSPDASWVRRERLAALTAEQKKKFLPLCPDFVVELRSESDSLRELQEKMVEYIENGTQLGWLIDADNRRVYVYRPNRDVEILENPSAVSGDPELPGFTLQLAEIWEPNL